MHTSSTDWMLLKSGTTTVILCLNLGTVRVTMLPSLLTVSTSSRQVVSLVTRSLALPT